MLKDLLIFTCFLNAISGKYTQTPQHNGKQNRKSHIRAGHITNAPSANCHPDLVTIGDEFKGADHLISQDSKEISESRKRGTEYQKAALDIANVWKGLRGKRHGN